MTNISFDGNLAEDPQLRFTTSGIAVADLVVLENRRHKDGETYVDDEPNRYRVQVWRQLAENVAESLTKGMHVLVVGQVKTDRWETNEGETRYTQVIDARHIGPDLTYQTATVTKATKRTNAND